MDNHFIKNIEIKNYKLFKAFQSEGFERVNLISGKNNVGKTAFMEACFLAANATNVESIAGALINLWFIRNYIECDDAPNTEILLEALDTLHIKTNIHNINIRIASDEGQTYYHLHINGIQIVRNKKEFSVNAHYTKHTNFLDNIGITYQELVELYQAIQENDKEDELNRAIQSFDNNIEKFKMFKDIPKVKTKGSDTYIELKELGDGLKEFVSIICALYSCKNGFLFIDEIANGIHYSNLDKVWEIILTLSKEQNVQVFATTHSKECIESFARVAKKLDDEKIAFIEMGINKYGQPRSVVMNRERFLRELETGNEVRGW